MIPNGAAKQLQIGEWSVHPQASRVTRGSEELHLRPQVMDLLVLLARHPGEVLSKDEILESLWSRQVVTESALTRTVAELRHALRDDPASPRYIETVPKRGYRLIAAVTHVAEAPRVRIAVLPFDNLRRDAESDYLADGVADSVTTDLAHIASLRVVSRQSTLRYRSSTTPVGEIALQLGVDCVVEGTVLQVGGRLRITAQLIQAVPEQHLWAEAYETDLADVFGVQRRVAHAIATSVGAALTPQEAHRLVTPPPVRPGAYLSLLKARYHWGKWTSEGLQKGMAHVREAIEVDPTFGSAQEMLAYCLVILGLSGRVPSRDAYAGARQAALRALELDPSLGDAHTVLAMVSWNADWDLDGFEGEIRLALELKPSSELARMMNAMYNGAMKRDRAETVAQGLLALDLDPLSLNTNFTVGWAFLFSGELELALERGCRTLELHPDAVQASYLLGWTCMAQGRQREAAARFENAAALCRDPCSLAYLGHAYGRCGREVDAHSLYAELTERSRTEYVAPVHPLVLSAGFRTLDQAFLDLEQCYAEKDSHLLWLPVMPAFEPLRADGRYGDVLGRVQALVKAAGAAVSA